MEQKMTYLDIVKNWLSLLTEHKDDIDKTTDDFINAYIKEYGETNEFDLIEVHKLIKLSYCLGLKKDYLTTTIELQSTKIELAHEIAQKELEEMGCKVDVVKAEKDYLHFFTNAVGGVNGKATSTAFPLVVCA